MDHPLEFAGWKWLFHMGDFHPADKALSWFISLPVSYMGFSSSRQGSILVYLIPSNIRQGLGEQGLIKLKVALHVSP